MQFERVEGPPPGPAVKPPKAFERAVERPAPVPPAQPWPPPEGEGVRSVCRLREQKGREIVTACGRFTKVKASDVTCDFVTIWESDVTCPMCLAKSAPQSSS